MRCSAWRSSAAISSRPMPICAATSVCESAITCATTPPRTVHRRAASAERPGRDACRDHQRRRSRGGALASSAHPTERIRVVDEGQHIRDTASPPVTIVPANEASWEDLEAVFGSRGDTSRCFCQRYKMQPGESWASFPPRNAPFGSAADRLRSPEVGTTSGLVAYLDGEPVGWCAVEPRTAYPRLLLKTRVPWDGRAEDKTDDSVWAVTCFVTRAGFRRRGISRALARAAVDFARERGARALEGYPLVTEAGQGFMPVELHVGSRSSFAAAGFAEVSHPTLRRVVMRIDFSVPGGTHDRRRNRSPGLRADSRRRLHGQALGPARQAGRPLLLSQGRHAGLHDAGLRPSATSTASSSARRGRARRRRDKVARTASSRRSTGSRSPSSPTPTTRSRSSTASGGRRSTTARRTWASSARPS